MRLSLVELLFRFAEERAHELAPTVPDAARIVACAVEEQSLPTSQDRAALSQRDPAVRTGRVDRDTHCRTLLDSAAGREVDKRRSRVKGSDRARRRSEDAAFHAAKALESTIKIISDDKGWSTGRERGAANYIDNLVSQQNGRFLAPWESDMLKAYFIHVRNPHGHGAGSQPPPVLTPHQTEWAIETTMAWIKNLVRRF